MRGHDKPIQNLPHGTMLQDKKLKIGVAGLGRAFMLMRPALTQHPRVHLTAAFDPRPEARAQFERDHGTAHTSIESLCADPAVDAVYIASPHQFHATHTLCAAAHGKHVLVEKPMALTLNDAKSMVAAAEQAGIHLLVGHSHRMDLPYRHTRKLIESGEFGQVRMITAINYTDFLYRPRRPEELDTTQGGGAIFNQAPHQIDIACMLAGSPVRTVHANTGNWDPTRPTEGAYAAHLTFENGAFASLIYNGYGRFDTDTLQGDISELGHAKPPTYHTARHRLNPAEEALHKSRRAYGTTPATPAEHPTAHNHFGLIIVSCDRADLRPTPHGVDIFAETHRFEPLPAPRIPRAEVLDELTATILDGRSEPHPHASGLAVLEICLAVQQSAATGASLILNPAPGPIRPWDGSNVPE